MSGNLKVDWPGLHYYGIIQYEYLVLLVSVQKDKDQNIKVACAPCLFIYGPKTWMLNRNLLR